MAVLRDESKSQTSAELLDDWERILLGVASPGSDLQGRRAELQQTAGKGISRIEIQSIADTFGFVITAVQLPYRPAFCGFSRFGLDRAAIPAAWQVIHIFVNTNGKSGQIKPFEATLKKRLLASHIPYFFYDGGKP
jgi:uncharacterized protein YmfQ (DUF2313 family)